MLQAEREENLSRNSFSRIFDSNKLSGFNKLSNYEIKNFVLRHRLELFFYKNEIVDYLRPELSIELKPYAIKETLNSLHLKDLTIEISKLLDLEKINYLIIKGIPLSYKTLNFKSSRGRGDLDILVDKSQILKCINILESNSFELFYTSIPRNFKSKRAKYCLWANYEASLIRKSDKGFQCIDLHWDLSYVRDNLPTFQDCWENRNESLIANYSVKNLSLKHEFLLACAHSAKDKWMSIRNLLDIDRLARLIDEKDIIIENKSRTLSMSALVTYDLSKGEYLKKYQTSGVLSRIYCNSVSSYFIKIESKSLSDKGWTPLSRLFDILHRLLLTNNAEDWLKIILSNLVTPQSIVNSKTRNINSFYKIFSNRISSLKNSLTNYLLKKIRNLLSLFKN
tara:strand:+ start:225 stop:1409 length:1185 start_codon:yes stop_codon:yes gene_type:complete